MIERDAVRARRRRRRPSARRAAPRRAPARRSGTSARRAPADARPARGAPRGCGGASPRPRRGRAAGRPAGCPTAAPAAAACRRRRRTAPPCARCRRSPSRSRVHAHDAAEPAGTSLGGADRGQAEPLDRAEGVPDLHDDELLAVAQHADRRHVAVGDARARRGEVVHLDEHLQRAPAARWCCGGSAPRPWCPGSAAGSRRGPGRSPATSSSTAATSARSCPRAAAAA